MATDVNLSQLPIEVVVGSDTAPETRLSQEPIEVLVGDDTNPPVYLSQAPVEVVVGDDTHPTVRLSQAPVEVVLLRSTTEHGYYRNQRGIAYSGERGYWRHKFGIQRLPLDPTKIQLTGRAITASTQDHDTQVTQTTSLIKLIRADGERGYFLSTFAMEAVEPRRDDSTADMVTDSLLVGVGASTAESVATITTETLVSARVPATTVATITTQTVVDVRSPAHTAGTITTQSTLIGVTASIHAAVGTELGETDVDAEVGIGLVGLITAAHAEAFSAPDATTSVTDIDGEVFGDPDDPLAALTRDDVEVFGGPGHPAHVTQAFAEVFGPQEIHFTNDLVIGLTWMEVTTRSGQFYVWSDRPLPDPASYYGGWKEPRVIEWGVVRRGASGWTGEYETASFDVTLSDTDRLLRELDRAQELPRASVVVRTISDAGRRALLTPRIVFRGIIGEWGPVAGLSYRLTIKDTFAEKFSYGTPHPDKIPLRTVIAEDFPNCDKVLVPPSASGYRATADYGEVAISIASPAVCRSAAHGLIASAAVQFTTTGALPTGLIPYTTYYVTNPTPDTFSVALTSGGPAIDTSGTQSGTHHIFLTYGLFGIGEFQMGVKDGRGIFPKGAQFHFASHSTTYTVEGSSRTDPETRIQFKPTLPAPIPDDDLITFLPSQQVSAAMGTPVPIVYGLITDRWLSEATGSTSGNSLPFDPTLDAPYAFAVDFTGGTLNGGVSFAVTAIRAGMEGPRSGPSGTGVQPDRACMVNWTAVAGAESYRVYLYSGDVAPYFNPNTGERSASVTIIRFQTHDTTTFDGLTGFGYGNTEEADYGMMWNAWTDGTDYDLVTGGTANDEGDGQAPAKYVGDRVLSDGRTYGEFLWAGHACYGQGLDRPIQQLYFWNDAVDSLARAATSAGGHGLWIDGQEIVIQNLATEADVGGRICLPGYGNWTANGFTDSFVDYNGRRYTVFFLSGIFRDWALGIMPAPANLGGIPLAVNGYGCATTADGDGALITNCMQQYLHIIRNWCRPIGEGYQSGPWLSSPTFTDDTSMSMFDDASFTTADVQSEAYVTSGFRGDFIIGANNEVISRRELIARLNFSFGVESAFNRKCQFMIALVNTNPASVTYQTALNFVRDIYTGTFSVETRIRELFNVIDFRHTQDYLNRAVGGWRSISTGVLESKDNDSVTIYDRSPSPQALFYMLRGKNTNSAEFHIADYQRGTDSINAILAIKLLHNGVVPHYAELQTGPMGMMYEIFQYVQLTDYEGVSSAGWTDQPMRIKRMEFAPTSFTTALTLYDMQPVWDRAESLLP